MNFFDKVKLNLGLAWRSLFYAMKAGDNEIFQTTDGKSNSEINHHINVGGAIQDMLKQEETEQVKELRDEYYRILLEADKYHVDVDMSEVLGDDGDLSEGNGDIKAVIRKKTSADFSQHCVVDESDGLKLRVIQDNKFIEKKSNFEVPNGSENPYDYFTLLDIERDEFRPKFEIEKFVTKIVVKNYTNTEAVIELYLPTNAKMFDSVSALYQSEFKKLFTMHEYKSETTDISSLSFVTDKAWNSEDLCLFKYDNISYKGISVFDGNYVMRFVGRIVNDGTPVTEKYKTKELDEKYKNKAPKSESVNLFAAQRDVNGIDFSKQILKVK